MNETALVERAQSLVPLALREPGAIAPDAARVYERLYKTIEQYDAPSLDNFDHRSLLRAYRATSQKDRFLRERVAPLERGMRRLTECTAPLGDLVLRADALEREELAEVGDLFATMARASAALATALVGAKSERSAAAAEFERAAAEARQRASTLADRTRDTPMCEQPELRNGMIFIVLTAARGGRAADDADRAHSFTARVICFLLLYAGIVGVLTVIGALVYIVTDREAGERLAALQVTTTGTSDLAYIPDWLRDMVGIARAIEPSVEPPPLVRALSLAGSAADVFAELRKTTAAVTAGVVRQTGAPTTVQVGVTQLLLPALYAGLATASQVFNIPAILGAIGLAWGVAFGRNQRDDLEERLAELQRQLQEMRGQT